MTGGIGAGKSEALRAFARHGAETASADQLVHDLYRDEDVKRALVDRWGDRVVDEDGNVDRRSVGEIVFVDREELAWLEGLVHPRTVAAQAAWRAALELRSDPPALAVVEVPLLYETGAEERFDAVVVITAPENVRAARTSVENLADREDRLLPDEEKMRRADFAYVNDGTVEELEEFVAGVVATLT